MARLQIMPLDIEGDVAALPVDDIKVRLEALHYDHLIVVDDGADAIEIECGFRWSPPFDRLLDITADLHVRLRCLYDEEGCCFMGAWRAADGKVLQDDCIDYC
jgi:hypothetical protein